MRLDQLGEHRLIELMLERLGPMDPELLVGPGLDDAAAWSSGRTGHAVFTIDAAVEGVHFDRSRQGPFDVGWRAIALALGDLAAMGAKPRYALVSVSFPVGLEVDWVDGLYQGIAAVASGSGLAVVGGDTTASPGPICITTALLGEAGPLLRRDRARPGWLVAVTGPLGRSGPGDPGYRGADAAGHANRLQPRLDVGWTLAKAGVRCAGDISDGLWSEMERIAAASGCGFSLESSLIPLVLDHGASRELALGRALGLGEEVELVCAASPRILARAAELMPSGTSLAVVGAITACGRRLLAADGSLMAAPHPYQRLVADPQLQP